MAVTSKDKKYYSVVLTDGSEQVSEHMTTSKVGAIEVANYIDEKRKSELKASKKFIEVLQVTRVNKDEVLTETIYYIKYAV